MRDNLGNRIEQVVGTGREVIHHLLDAAAIANETESDAEAIHAERAGRSNTAREARVSHQPEPGRWDVIGESEEGLDDLQGHYAADASPGQQLARPGAGSSPSTADLQWPPVTAITPALWDQLAALVGQTVETPKGEPFGVKDVRRGVSVTVRPLDGGQAWDVPAQELETSWMLVHGGEPLDRLASIRLREAGLGSRHPEYVAGLLQAIAGDDATYTGSS